MMSNFRRENGKATTPEDPHRLIWYSAGCTYWTDDWDHVATDRRPPIMNPDGTRSIRPGAIPHCPRCGAVGFQGEFDPWLKSAEAYEAGKQEHDPKPHPGYVKALLAKREICSRRVLYPADEEVKG